MNTSQIQIQSNLVASSAQISRQFGGLRWLIYKHVQVVCIFPINLHRKLDTITFIKQNKYIFPSSVENNRTIIQVFHSMHGKLNFKKKKSACITSHIKFKILKLASKKI